ncbi:MAG: hypothetical protein KKF80_07440, partial [Candidatus Omnitrophica bacterium]|nr:hypothetical protein [Candidatus Omnitrophota bacterium]
MKLVEAFRAEAQKIYKSNGPQSSSPSIANSHAQNRRQASSLAHLERVRGRASSVTRHTSHVTRQRERVRGRTGLAHSSQLIAHGLQNAEGVRGEKGHQDTKVASYQLSNEVASSAAHNRRNRRQARRIKQPAKYATVNKSGLLSRRNLLVGAAAALVAAVVAVNNIGNNSQSPTVRQDKPIAKEDAMRDVYTLLEPQLNAQDKIAVTGSILLLKMLNDALGQDTFQRIINLYSAKRLQIRKVKAQNSKKLFLLLQRAGIIEGLPGADQSARGITLTGINEAGAVVYVVIIDERDFAMPASFFATMEHELFGHVDYDEKHTSELLDDKFVENEIVAHTRTIEDLRHLNGNIGQQILSRLQNENFPQEGKAWMKAALNAEEFNRRISESDGFLQGYRQKINSKQFRNVHEGSSSVVDVFDTLQAAEQRVRGRSILVIGHQSQVTRGERASSTAAQLSDTAQATRILTAGAILFVGAVLVYTGAYFALLPAVATATAVSTAQVHAVMAAGLFVVGALFVLSLFVDSRSLLNEQPRAQLIPVTARASSTASEVTRLQSHHVTSRMNTSSAVSREGILRIPQNANFELLPKGLATTLDAHKSNNPNLIGIGAKVLGNDLPHLVQRVLTRNNISRFLAHQASSTAVTQASSAASFGPSTSPSRIGINLVYLGLVATVVFDILGVLAKLGLLSLVTAGVQAVILAVVAILLMWPLLYSIRKSAGLRNNEDFVVLLAILGLSALITLAIWGLVAWSVVTGVTSLVTLAGSFWFWMRGQKDVALALFAISLVSAAATGFLTGVLTVGKIVAWAEAVRAFVMQHPGWMSILGYVVSAISAFIGVLIVKNHRKWGLILIGLGIAGALGTAFAAGHLTLAQVVAWAEVIHETLMANNAYWLKFLSYAVSIVSIAFGIYRFRTGHKLQGVMFILAGIAGLAATAFITGYLAWADVVAFVKAYPLTTFLLGWLASILTALLGYYLTTRASTGLKILGVALMLAGIVGFVATTDLYFGWGLIAKLIALAKVNPIAVIGYALSAIAFAMGAIMLLYRELRTIGVVLMVLGAIGAIATTFAAGYLAWAQIINNALKIFVSVSAFSLILGVIAYMYGGHRAFGRALMTIGVIGLLIIAGVYLVELYFGWAWLEALNIAALGTLIAGVKAWAFAHALASFIGISVISILAGIVVYQFFGNKDLGVALIVIGTVGLLILGAVYADVYFGWGWLAAIDVSAVWAAIANFAIKVWGYVAAYPQTAISIISALSFLLGVYKYRHNHKTAGIVFMTLGILGGLELAGIWVHTLYGWAWLDTVATFIINVFTGDGYVPMKLLGVLLGAISLYNGVRLSKAGNKAMGIIFIVAGILLIGGGALQIVAHYVNMSSLLWTGVFMSGLGAMEIVTVLFLKAQATYIQGNRAHEVMSFTVGVGFLLSSVLVAMGNLIGWQIAPVVGVFVGLAIVIGLLSYLVRNNSNAKDIISTSALLSILAAIAILAWFGVIAWKPVLMILTELALVSLAALVLTVVRLKYGTTTSSATGSSTSSASSGSTSSPAVITQTASSSLSDRNLLSSGEEGLLRDKLLLYSTSGVSPPSKASSTANTRPAYKALKAITITIILTGVLAAAVIAAAYLYPAIAPQAAAAITTHTTAAFNAIMPYVNQAIVTIAP